MNCKRGDVAIVWFPHSDQRSFSRRPALVVQSDNLNTGIEQVVIVLITTNLNRLGHPSRVFIEHSSEAGEASGLVADFVIMTDNITTVLGKAVHSIIGAMPDMGEVDSALRHTLGL